MGDLINFDDGDNDPKQQGVKTPQTNPHHDEGKALIEFSPVKTRALGPLRIAEPCQVAPMPRRLTAPPLPLHQQWDQQRREGVYQVEHSKLGIATYSVTHDMAAQITRLLHNKLSRQTNVEVEVLGGDGARPILIIRATDEDTATDHVKIARTLTDELLLNRPTSTKGLMLEPPDCPKKSARISLQILGSLGARPMLLPGHEQFTSSQRRARHHDAYMNDVSQSLALALKRVGHIDIGSVPEIRFGRHFLRLCSPPGETYTFDQLSATVKHTLDVGHFTHIKSRLDEVQQVLSEIKKDGSPFAGPSLSVASSIDVTPEIVFEGNAGGHKVRGTLWSAQDEVVGRNGATTNFHPVQILKLGELDWATISMERNLDWKLYNVMEVPVLDDRAQPMESYIRGATVNWSRQAGVDNPDMDCPHVFLPHTNPRARDFQKVTIKSVFRFRFKCTVYLVDFEICREYGSVLEMNNRAIEPTISYGFRVSSDLWGFGCPWGSDLEHLFPGKDLVDVQDKVKDFVGCIHAIRGALETAMSDSTSHS